MIWACSTDASSNLHWANCIVRGILCRMLFAFDDLELDTAQLELRRDGVRVPMEPQAFDVLAYLLAHRDRVVSKEELMDAIWGGRFVSETAVTSRIKQARRAIGDDGGAQRFIRTLHGRGYRFVTHVEELLEAQQHNGFAVPVTPPVVRPHVQYTLSDGLNIAYQVTGGPGPDIVLVAGFVSHLEQDWGDPRHAHFLDRLGTFGRLIRFDKRGTGMSDRPFGIPDLETRMHDVLAVLDATGAQRPVLFGYSEGGPMATLFAAAHPERVSSLILYGAYSKRTSAPGYEWAQSETERAAYSKQLVSSWDWETDMLMRCPSADAAMTSWWAQRARAAATPMTVERLMDMNALVDVRDALGSVRVPTLVVHRKGDQMVHIEHGRYAARQIAGARLVELEGDDHFVSGNPDQILDPIQEFLISPPPPTQVRWVLAAVIGVAGPDSAEVLARLESAGGQVRPTASGRPVVLFDGPATAIRAGDTSLVGLTGALSVHVAEIDPDAVPLNDFGADVATALADLAPINAMWASATVRDLLAGSGIELVDAGVYRIGSTGDHQLFSVLIGR